MKTVQEYLRQANRERLLDAMAYDTLCDTLLLMKYRDRTTEEIQDACKKHMDEFIDYLLSIEAVPSDHMVLYMTNASIFHRGFNQADKMLCLTDINEVRKDIYAVCYAFELSPWEETLGFLVADNKLTQDYMIELLSQFLNELSFFGSDPEQHREEVEKVFADLDQSMKDVEAGHTIPAEEVFEELRKEYGWPVDEKDDFQDQLHSEIIEADMKYSRYCEWRERSRILKSLGETAPSFEEAEEIRKESE